MIDGMCVCVCVCLYVYECALLERWVYVLCYVSCLSFFLPMYKIYQFKQEGHDGP